MPAVPQPPSLKLPEPVTNLAAVRTGNEVHLTWTMSRRTTDKIPLKTDQPVHICRKLGKGPCQAAGDTKAAPSKTAEYTDALPAELAAGPPRLLVYEIELRSPAGRTAGPSNLAYTVAGAAPAPLTALAGEVRGDGVVLRWQPSESGTPPAVRIHRELLLPPGSAQKSPDAKPEGEKPQAEAQPLHSTNPTAQGAKPASPPSSHESAGVPEPQFQTLEVANNPGLCLDRDASFDKTYRYSAQRVLKLTLEGHVLELLGTPSNTITLLTKDVFPPAVPAGLAAVADPAGKAIDLSWIPGTEPDLAGYIVYRREAGSSAPPQRISPANPAAASQTAGEAGQAVVAPSFHDASLTPNTRYAYSVSAIDHDGNQSERSPEVEETLPPDTPPDMPPDTPQSAPKH